MIRFLKIFFERAGLLVFAALLLCASLVRAQVTATPFAVNQSGVPAASTLVTVCLTNPGSGTCASPVALYTDITLGYVCNGSLALLNNQTAPTVTSGCSNPGYTDLLGNVLAYAVPGQYWCQYSGASLTTYSQPCPVPGFTSSSSGSGYGVDVTKFSGSDPCLQIQAAIYSIGTTHGGIVNATAIPLTSTSTCSVNPFSTPAQSNPLDFSGLPPSGLLLLPSGTLPVNYPFYQPNFWTVQGVPGYGPYPEKTQIQPSTTFLANRPQISAVGTGSTGLSASGGQTVTITGTTLPSCQNLIGMFLLGSSNASATAVPDTTNAQIGGAITACSGNTLTLGGAGASGTVSNTGWMITPVIAGWNPSTAVYGAGVTNITVTCQTPSLTYVYPGCITWLDVSAQEMSYMDNDNLLYFDFCGLCIFTANSQNGGPFTKMTIASKGQGNSGTIGVQLYGSGWNAGGGGSSGLCSLTNSCSGSSIRRMSSITMLLDDTALGNGGTGFDIGAAGFELDGPGTHCEKANVCARIGQNDAASTIKIDGLAGCSVVGCADASVVDISSNYTSVNPGPTQNITLANITRGYAGTWAFRDYSFLVGSTDPGVKEYSWGSHGSVTTQMITSTQPLSCITTGGVVDTNGAHCPAGSVLPMISKLDGTYYCYGFNANGTADVGQQIYNCMQWAYTNLGATNGAIFDASGFTRTSGVGVNVSPWSGGAGTYPYSGVLKQGCTAWFLSSQMTIPTNWIFEGCGGQGIGTGGGTGSAVSPNITNTSNPAYANDTVSGTVSCTAGSYTCTGSGSNFTSANLNHYLMACATLPCTTQSTMVGAIISAVGSTTTITLSTPAQSTVTSVPYTITAPLIVNNGIMRDVAVEANSYTSGGMTGILQNNIPGSYLENVSVNHVNALGIAVNGINSGALLRAPISVAGGAGVASSVFTCVSAPQGVTIESLVCNSVAASIPPLSYGVFASGTNFKMDNLTLEDVNIGLELAVNPNFVTSGDTITNVLSGTGSSATNTLIDLGGVSSGSTGINFSANIFGLSGAGAATALVNDHLQGWSATDTTLNYYQIGKQIGGCRTFQYDGHTSGIPQSIQCGTLQIGTGTTTWSTSVGAPTRACNPGDIDTNTSASSASTVLYVCSPANTWTAVTVP